MRSSAFQAAMVHLRLALDVLGEARWWYDDQYEICSEVYNPSDETYHVTADFEKMHVTLDEVFQNTKSFRDKLQAYTILVCAYGAHHYLQKAIETASDVLRQRAEMFPSRHGKLSVFLYFVTTQWMLREKCDPFRMNLPVPTDPHKTKLETIQYIIMKQVNQLIVKWLFLKSKEGFVTLLLTKFLLCLNQCVQPATCRTRGDIPFLSQVVVITFSIRNHLPGLHCCMRCGLGVV
jgi:hypothetical protein